MNNEKIPIQLSLEEVKTILQSIGQQPYLQVYGLINNIQGQVASHFEQQKSQLQNEAPSESSVQAAKK